MEFEWLRFARYQHHIHVGKPDYTFRRVLSIVVVRWLTFAFNERLLKQKPFTKQNAWSTLVPRSKLNRFRAERTRDIAKNEKRKN